MSHSILAVPIAFFAFLAIVILLPVWLRHRARMLALRTIGEAIERGRATDAALIERLLMPSQPNVGKGFALVNLTLGVPAFCIGIALALGGQHVGSMMIGSIGIGLTSLGLISTRLFSRLVRPAPHWDYASVLALVCFFLGASGLSIATGLTLSAQLFAGPANGAATDAGMPMGALVNACSGIGFIGLGIGLLRAFAADRKP